MHIFLQFLFFSNARRSYYYYYIHFSKKKISCKERKADWIAMSTAADTQTLSERNK